MSGLYAKCEACAKGFSSHVLPPLATGWLNHHLGVNDGNQPCAARPGYHLKGTVSSYHQVIKKLVAELDRSVVFVRSSGFLRH